MSGVLDIRLQSVRSPHPCAKKVPEVRMSSSMWSISLKFADPKQCETVRSQLRAATKPQQRQSILANLLKSATKEGIVYPEVSEEPAMTRKRRKSRKVSFKEEVDEIPPKIDHAGSSSEDDHPKEEIEMEIEREKEQSERDVFEKSLIDDEDIELARALEESSLEMARSLEKKAGLTPILEEKNVLSKDEKSDETNVQEIGDDGITFWGFAFRLPYPHHVVAEMTASAKNSVIAASQMGDAARVAMGDAATAMGDAAKVAADAMSDKAVAAAKKAADAMNDSAAAARKFMPAGKYMVLFLFWKGVMDSRDIRDTANQLYMNSPFHNFNPPFQAMFFLLALFLMLFIVVMSLPETIVNNHPYLLQVKNKFKHPFLTELTQESGTPTPPIKTLLY